MRTVTIDRVAGLPVRHPEMVAAGRHYGMSVETCVPYDPETKGGSEATVRVAKADLVPTEANLLDVYPSFGALTTACDVIRTLAGKVPFPDLGPRLLDHLAALLPTMVRDHIPVSYFRALSIPLR